MKNIVDNAESKRIRAFYDRNSLLYDKSRFSDKSGRALDLLQKHIVLELCKKESPKTTLEVGVGTARFSPLLRKISSEVIGIDFSSSMIKIAKSKKNKLNLKDKKGLILADASKLPFKSGSFDLIVSINVLNHIPEYSRAVTELTRVLRQGGALIVNFPNLVSLCFPIGIIVNLRRRSIIRPVFASWFPFSQIFSLLSENGVFIEEVQGHLPIESNLIFKTINRRLRKSIFKYLLGVIFIKARKQSKGLP